MENLNYFLGSREEDWFWQHSLISHYFQDLLKKAIIEEAESIKTPIVSDTELSAYGTGEVENPKLYRDVVNAFYNK